MHLLSFNLPKIELHAHIGGCIRSETFLELTEKKGINIEHLDFYSMSLEMAFEVFKVSAQILTDLPTLERVTREIIDDYAKFNTIYLELRSSPKIYQGSTMEQYVDSLIKVMAEKEGAIKTRYLMSFNRAQSEEQFAETTRLAKKFIVEEKNPFVVGVEVSGHPQHGSFAKLLPYLRELKELGVKISIHTSETPEQ